MNLADVETNMVYVDFSALRMPMDRFMKELQVRELAVTAIPPTRIRMVTHRHITAADVATAAEILRDVVGK
ncbi:MAG TPA: hypothetical protein PKZ08_16495 [Vicinamibacterales bacterium]|nr:hypothetical protein [Vicinamibacterales bacterium]